MVESECERHGAAKRMPDDDRTLQPQRLTKAADDPRLGGKRRQCFVRPQRVAAAGPVENDDAEVVPEPSEQRMRKVENLTGEPMNEQQHRPAALVDIVQAHAVDIDEFSAWRQIGFY